MRPMAMLTTVSGGGAAGSGSTGGLTVRTLGRVLMFTEGSGCGCGFGTSVVNELLISWLFSIVTAGRSTTCSVKWFVTCSVMCFVKCRVTFSVTCSITCSTTGGSALRVLVVVRRGLEGAATGGGGELVAFPGFTAVTGFTRFFITTSRLEGCGWIG